MAFDPGPYLGAFQILTQDFRRLAEYVEPTDSNLGTCSHRLYELLLRTCTAFESACKEDLVSQGTRRSPSDMNINDYRTLEPHLKLEARKIGILIWQPAPSYIKPFAGWSSNNPPLSWYRAYNQVKHNRNTHFRQASLENVRHAMAGLFALLEGLGVIDHAKQFGVSDS